MRAFADLIRLLDSTNKTNVKVAALADYFRSAPDRDKVWAIAILSHRRPPRPVNTTLLREWASDLAGIPHWLFEESYHIVGDLAETIALVVPSDDRGTERSLADFLDEMPELRKSDEAVKRSYLERHWKHMDYYERFVFTKLITGSFRIGVSQKLMTRALAQATEQEEDVLAYKLMGDWDPGAVSFNALVVEEQEGVNLSRPYPFYLAYALEESPESLGDVKEWAAEYKWDGIRSQVILRGGELFTWTRGEELVTDRYPEFEPFIGRIPDGTVIDGEILPFKDGEIGDFNMLQTRIGRKRVTKSLLEKVPVVLRAYDLLEWEGQDLRERSYDQRRKLLEALVADTADLGIPLQLSETLDIASWEDMAAARDRSREVRSEGLMLKHRNSPYRVGRKKGDWWKWKVDPLTIDAVLTYAMRGHGRRSNLFTDYTFALWDTNETGERELVTFAKAYSGLTDKEFRQLDAWIKRNTLERFGPVRSVTPHHVFEIAFEGIAESSRHKSGVATRFPRIHRWRKDKPMEEADTLEQLKKLIP